MELFSSVVRPLESVSMAFELGGRKGGEEGGKVREGQFRSDEGRRKVRLSQGRRKI